MLRKLSRRELVRGIGGVAVAGLAGATMVGRPARAGVGWGTGPNSGLPFWHGGYSDLDHMVSLLPPGRGLDLIGEFESEGTYLGVATACANSWGRKRWYLDFLKTGRTSAFQWSSSPFCSGPSMVVPDSWPTSAAAVTAGTHLHCSAPPTYTGSETAAERSAKQRQVWQIAADGWLDPIWRQKMLIFKRDFFIKYQDRLVFGKDIYEPSEYTYYFRVFETKDDYIPYYRRRHAFWRMYGLYLPDEVLKKVYYKNALKLVQGMPAKDFPQ